jgi:hypothetical protein
MKNAVFWDVSRVALVRTDVSEEINASIIRVTRIAYICIFAATIGICVCLQEPLSHGGDFHPMNDKDKRGAT